MYMTTLTPDLAAAHAVLVSSIEGLIASNTWQAHLATQAKFHNYSFNNVLWLSFQAAGRGIQPQKFAGFNSWKKVGRSVMKGEKSYKVLAPVMVRDRKNESDKFILCGFKVVSTFEKSQTDGKELPEVCSKLQGTSEEALQTYAKLSAFAQKRGWSVEKGETGSANGFADLMGKRIVVSPLLSDLQAVKTLCHEVAHSMMHADEIGSHGSDVREVEAESVAFVVLNALGFDSAAYSFGYVAIWSKGDIELVKKTGERVQRAAKTILEALGAKGEDAAE
jgi:hypothetical protein